MKHLFLINSHTSFLSAAGTVEYLSLKPSDVVFLTARYYKNSLSDVKWKTIDFSDIFAKYTTHEVWHERKKRNDYQSEIDNFISENFKEDFIFYCCHFAHPAFQMIYTNPLCKEGAYLQEGGVPFKTTYVTDPSLWEKIFNWSVNHLFLRTKRCHFPLVWYYPGFLSKQKEVHSYAISDSFFKYLPSINHIITWPRKKINVEIKEDSTIFIFDGFVKNTFCELNIYLENCNRLIIEEARKYNYVRFHPAQGTEEKKSILEFFHNNGLMVEEMDSSIPFEWILLSDYKMLNVCGFGSSLLFFAKDMGYNVVCRDEWLAASPKYRKYKKDCGFLWFKDSF